LLMPSFSHGVVEVDLAGKFVGAMLAAALGDSMGAGLRRGRDRILRYTDDTAMMIVIAELLIEDRGELDAAKLALRFAEAYEREPWRGYGPGPPRIFMMIKRGEGPLELDKKLYPGGSFGNGAAMRVTPIGLLFHDDLDRLRRAVSESCKPTHNHPLAVEGALIEAASIAKAVKLDPAARVDAKDFIEELVEELDISEKYREKLEKIPRLIESDAGRRVVVELLGNGVEALNSVPTAVYCYLREQDPMRSIRAAMSLGGDVDTISCMAAAIAGAHKGVEAIPGEELERLENAEYIRRLAVDLYRVKASRGRNGI